VDLGQFVTHFVSFQFEYVDINQEGFEGLSQEINDLALGHASIGSFGGC
jgi:hypothetical protein